MAVGDKAEPARPRLMVNLAVEILNFLQGAVESGDAAAAAATDYWYAELFSKRISWFIL